MTFSTIYFSILTSVSQGNWPRPLEALFYDGAANIFCLLLIFADSLDQDQT